MSSLNHSYWEENYLRKPFDFIIVGSGICGCSTALFLNKRNPKARIAILEKKTFGNAASTKNAGFACFGSAGKILDDVSAIGWDKTHELLKMRLDGLRLLKKNTSAQSIDFKNTGGWEVFSSAEDHQYQAVLDQLTNVNKRFRDILPAPYQPMETHRFFNHLKSGIFQPGEGELNPKLLMLELQHQLGKNVQVFRGCRYNESTYSAGSHYIQTSLGELKARHLIVTTNVNVIPDKLIEKDTLPARAQVLVSEKFSSAVPTGVFHAERGYAYFRFIDGRLLLGGFRNKFEDQEYTSSQETSSNLIEQLVQYGTAITGEKITPAFQWAGTMSVSKDRFPWIGVENNIAYGIKMGGMGVAVGSFVGKKLSDLLA